MNSKLIKLQNGQWIDPQTITSIVPADKVPYSPARVIVHAGPATAILDCEDFGQAKEVASKLAEQVNASRDE